MIDEELLRCAQRNLILRSSTSGCLSHQFCILLSPGKNSYSHGDWRGISPLWLPRSIHNCVADCIAASCYPIYLDKRGQRRSFNGQSRRKNNNEASFGPSYRFICSRCHIASMGGHQFPWFLIVCSNYRGLLGWTLS